MADEKIQIDITAKDDTSKKIDDVADSAAELEKVSPEVAVTADTGGAVADLKSVGEAADRVAQNDTVLVIKAQIDQAKGELSALQTELKQTGEQADTTNRKLDDTTGTAGPGHLRGNAIADLTGPLGDASSAASDFAGVFDGLGDAAEAAAGKLGLSQGVAEKLGSAIGGLGVAVAAGAAIWSLWTAHAEAARKKAKELADEQVALGRALIDGNAEAARTNFHKLYDDAVGAAEKFGLKQQDVIRFITGQADAIPGLTSKYLDLQAARDKLDPSADKARADIVIRSFEDTSAALDKARDSYGGAAGKATDATLANKALDTALGIVEPSQKDMNRAVADSIPKLDAAEQSTRDLEAGYSALDDRLSNTRAIEDFQAKMIEAQQAIHDKSKDTVVDVRGVEDAIVQAGKTAGLTPIEIQTEIDRVEQGDIDGAFLDTQRKIDSKGPLNMNVKIHPELPPRLKIVTRGGTTLLDEALTPIAASAAPSTVVNVTLPRGVRSGDIARAVGVNRRRNGKRYGVTE